MPCLISEITMDVRQGPETSAHRRHHSSPRALHVHQERAPGGRLWHRHTSDAELCRGSAQRQSLANCSASEPSKATQNVAASGSVASCGSAMAAELTSQRWTSTTGAPEVGQVPFTSTFKAFKGLEASNMRKCSQTHPKAR